MTVYTRDDLKRLSVHSAAKSVWYKSASRFLWRTSIVLAVLRLSVMSGLWSFGGIGPVPISVALGMSAVFALFCMHDSAMHDDLAKHPEKGVDDGDTIEADTDEPEDDVAALG